MIVPDGWTETTIGDLCEVVAGSTPKTAVSEYWDGDIAWITPDDLSRHRAKYIDRGARSITQAGYDSCSTRLVPKGSVLYTTRAPIGYVAVAGQPVCTNQGFKNFVLPPTIDSSYIYWYLRYATPMIRNMGSGTTFKEVSKKVAQSIPLVLPPTITEQRLIVQAIEEQFSRLDAAEGSLVTGEARLRQFRRKLLHTCTTAWDATALLSDVAEVVSGQTPKDLHAVPGGAIPFYKVGDMNTTSGKSMGEARTYLDEAAVARLGVKVRPAGTVVFPKRGGAIATNKKRILEAPAAFDLNTMGVIPGPDLEPAFLLAWFDSLDLGSLSDGSNIPQINHNDIAPLRIPIPPLELQRELVVELERSDSVARAVGQQISMSRKHAVRLRQSVLREAFAGRLVPRETVSELDKKVGA